MKMKFVCSKNLFFPFCFTLTKAIITALHFYCSLSFIIEEIPNISFIFALMEAIPLLLWGSLALVSYCNQHKAQIAQQPAINQQLRPNEELICQTQWSQPQPIKPHDQFLFIISITICGLITFFNSLVIYSKLITYFFLGLTHLFSISFTQLFLKPKWYSHHKLGFGLILFCAITFSVMVFIYFQDAFSINHTLILSMLFILLIPVRDIIEKYVIDRYKVNVIHLLAYEDGVGMIGLIIYLIYVIAVREIIIGQIFNDAFTSSFLVGYVVIGAIYQWLGVKTLQLYNPNFKYIGDGLACLTIAVSLLSMGMLQDHSVLSVIGMTFGIVLLFGLYFIGSVVFNEVLILSCCDLEKNTQSEQNKAMELIMQPEPCPISI